VPCPACSSDDQRSLADGNAWCVHCGTLVIGQLLASSQLEPEVLMPELLQDLQEWRQQYLRPTMKEFGQVVRGVRDV
jgi:hypothetical protein